MIRIKHILVVFALSMFAAQSSQAQIGWGLSAGYRGGIVNWKSFNQFQNSYSEFYKSSIKKDFTGFGIGSGFAFNGDMTAGPTEFIVPYAWAGRHVLRGAIAISTWQGNMCLENSQA